MQVIPVELFEYVDDFYLISETANKTLKQLRIGLPTWFSKEKYNEMNVSIWVYHDETVNAFCYYKDSTNYIALSVGLLKAFWDVAEDFANHEKLSMVFKISGENKSHLIDSLYFYMLNFTIAHECGHIVHGHLREKSGENCIDEMLQMSNEIEGHERKARNWHTQLKEYDADSFAVSIQSLLFLQEWSDNNRVNFANFDIMFIANYLCFQTFAEKMGRSFDAYLMKDIEEYDHPHPGIRMYYSIILYSFWIGRVRDFGEDTMAILNSGSHAVISYDKSVLLKLRTPF